jgi:uncharacterized protein
MKYYNLSIRGRHNVRIIKSISEFRKTPGLKNIARIKNYNIIYSPLAGRIYSLGEKEFDLFKTLPEKKIKKNLNLKEFINSGILIPDKSNLPLNFFFRNKYPKEKKISLFLGNKCNASCRYCYGSFDKEIRLKFNLAKKIIDEFIKERKPEKMAVTFHGGGEPMLDLDLINKITGYLKKKKMEATFSTQTNGVISDRAREWILRKTKSVAVSCDGPPDIQNFQRPLRNGGKSSPFTEKTIKFLVENNYNNLFINIVISSFSVNRMEEIVEYFHNLGVKIIGFSLLSENERSRKNKIYTPDLNQYLENALKAVKLADDYKMKTRFELLPINEPTFCFCGLPYFRFCVTPDGYVSDCYETTSKNSGIKDFIYGSFNEKSNKIIYYKDRMNRLGKRLSENIKDCQKCYLKLVCAVIVLLEFTDTREIYLNPTRQDVRQVESL